MSRVSQIRPMPGAFVVTSDISVREFSDDPETWNRWLEDAPDARFCHQYEWLQLVRDVYGGEPHYLAAYRGDEIAGVMPVMLRSVIGEGRVLYATPFADEGGCCTEDPQVEAKLVEAATQVGDGLGASYLEVRQRAPLSVEAMTDESRVTLEMPLPSDSEVLWDDLSKNMRKKVRRARRDGLTSEEVGPDFLGTFYEIYASNMQDLGSPMHSQEFFEALYSRFPEDMVSVAVRLEDSRATVGAAVAIKHGQVMTVLCAHSAREYFDLYPNNLLYWRLFEEAIDRGCRVANFGRSPVDTGIYRYKKSWHMEDHQLYYSRIPIKGQPGEADGRQSKAYELFRRIWPHLPARIARSIGPRLWARLPI